MTNTSEHAVSALAINGEFTIFTATSEKIRLLDAISQGSGADIAIDLSNVTEIDSAGLQLMVLAKREAAALDRTLRFVGHSSAVLDLLDLTGLAGFFGDPVLIYSNT